MTAISRIYRRRPTSVPELSNGLDVMSSSPRPKGDRKFQINSGRYPAGVSLQSGQRECDEHSGRRWVFARGVRMVARCLRHLIKLHPRLSSRDRCLYGQRNDQEESGLGTSLVKALAQQLGAQVVIVNNPTGVSVSITHATFNARVSHAA